MNQRDKRRRAQRAKVARQITIEYRNGKPTPHAEETLDQLGVAPAFVGETMTCAVCGAVEVADAHRESNWRAIDVDGQRSYFCPAEFPTTSTDTYERFKFAYERALLFAMAARNPRILAIAKTRGLDRPIDWSRQ